MPANRTRAALFFLLGSFGAGVGGASAQDELPPDLEVRVDAAIDAGVGFLLKEVEGPSGWSPGTDFPSGYAGVQVYALVKSDVSYTHPVVQKGIAAMEAPFEKVYYRLKWLKPVNRLVLSRINQVDQNRETPLEINCLKGAIAGGPGLRRIDANGTVVTDGVMVLRDPASGEIVLQLHGARLVLDFSQGRLTALQD